MPASETAQESEQMPRSKKKSWKKAFKHPVTIVAGVIAVIIATAWLTAALSGGSESTYGFVTTEARDLVQEVSVTGKVEAVTDAELAFEVSGKVTEVNAKVGDRVDAGQTLVRLDASVLGAQLASAGASIDNARAARDQQLAVLQSEQARLDELRRGARDVELDVSQARVTSAQESLESAEQSLRDARDDAEAALDNLYATATDSLNQAVTTADDVVSRVVDPLYMNDDTLNPKMSFQDINSPAETSAEAARLQAGQAVDDMIATFDSLDGDPSRIDSALVSFETHLGTVSTMLFEANRVLQEASLILPSSTLASYQSAISAGRSSVDASLASVRTARQGIATQRTANETSLNQARSAITEAKSGVNLAQEDLQALEAGTAEEVIRQQEARVAQAQGAVAAAEASLRSAGANASNYSAQLRKYALVAPVSGIVTAMELEAGEIASPNRMVARVASESDFKITANVPEVDIAKVKSGDPAVVTLDAYGSDEQFDATVTFVDPAETVVEGVSTYEVTLQFDQEDERVKSGMTANIDILTASRDDVIAVPQRSVISQDGRRYVRVLRGDNEIEERDVETGLRGSDGTVEILSGLEPGLRVVTFIEE